MDQTNNQTTIPDVANSGNDLITEISNQLLEQGNIASSQAGEIDQSIQNAIQGVQTSAEASNAAITSQYDREIAFQSGQGELAVQGQLDSRSGFATNMVALRNLVDLTDKNLNDLEQRKQELILQNNAQAAAQIAGLEFQALQYKQQATQQVFSNLLSFGQFALSVQQEQRLQSAQDFAERSAIADIALQYGLTVNEGDTLDTIVTRAMPIASEQQKLQLEKLRADIAYTNTQISNIKSGVTGTYTPDIAASAIASIRMDGTLSEDQKTERIYAIMSMVNDPAAVYQAEGKLITEATQPDYLYKKYAIDLRNGGSKSTLEASIAASTWMSPEQKQVATTQLNNAYNDYKAETNTGGGLFGGISLFGNQSGGSSSQGSGYQYQTVPNLSEGYSINSLFNFYK